jgi:hypothetical protein
MRFFGEVLIHRRNAYLYQELIDDRKRRRRFLRNLETDLGIVEANAGGEALVSEVIGVCRGCLQPSSRNVDTDTKPRHIVVEIARRLSGDGWLDILRERAAAAQAIHF